MDEDNDLYIVGRIAKEERFKVQADVVYAQPIEDVMKKYEPIKDIVIIGRPTGSTHGDEIVYCVM